MSSVVILPKGRHVIRRNRLTGRDAIEARAQAHALPGPVSPISRARPEPRRSPSASSLSSVDSESAQPFALAHPEVPLVPIMWGPTRICRRPSSSLSEAEE